MPKHHIALCSITFFCCLLTACTPSKKGPACQPVHGKVTSKGKPLAEATLVLHRLGGDIEGNQKPMAIANPDGMFTFTTFKQNDGAPLGDYAITVELRAIQTGGEEPTRSGPNTLPPKYAKPSSSGLKYTVVEGDNEIPVIDIK